MRNAPKNSSGRVVHSDRVLNADKALGAEHTLPLKTSAKQVSEQTQAKRSRTHEAQSQHSLQEPEVKVISCLDSVNVNASKGPFATASS